MKHNFFTLLCLLLAAPLSYHIHADASQEGEDALVRYEDVQKEHDEDDAGDDSAGYYPLPESLRSLYVSNDSGEIEIKTVDPEDDDEQDTHPGVTVVRKHFDPEYHRFEFKKQGDAVELVSAARTSDDAYVPCEVDYLIVLPAGVSVKIQQGQGKVELKDLTQNVHVALGQGKIKGKSLSGPVDVFLGQGEVDLKKLASNVTLKVGQGDIELDYQKDLIGEHATPYKLHFDLGEGDVELKFPEEAHIASGLSLSPHVKVKAPHDLLSPEDPHHFLLTGRIGSGSLEIDG